MAFLSIVRLAGLPFPINFGLRKELFNPETGNRMLPILWPTRETDFRFPSPLERKFCPEMGRNDALYRIYTGKHPMRYFSDEKRR